ncbi:MAG: cupin domain-containing protein [Acidobacteriaceae bacterium]|nr:cupin domain-containing protein [Acidobacteriaceae bacterium]
MKPCCLLVLICAAAFAQQDMVWAPKADVLPKYAPPHKPLTKLADAKAKHSGQSSWTELVVNDDLLRGEYVQDAAGAKVAKHLHPDTREFWIILDGQIRFDIEGQQPFTAKKGWMVQVPMQTWFSMETAADKPSLRWQVNVANAHTLYAEQADAPQMSGYHWMQVKMASKPGVYGHNNKPYVTFEEAAKLNEEGKVHGTQRIVQDDRETGNFIYGYEKNLPPLNPNDKGHYHPESSEFWLVMAGQIRYPIEGQGVVIANEGDVVYVPRFTFHAPRFYGPGPSCRFAMNGYPDIAHLFEAKPAAATTSSR